MLFNSWAFLLLFLPAALGISFLLRGSKLLFWISAMSYLFYGLMGGWWFLVPMTITVVVDFFVAQQIESHPSRVARKFLLALSLCANLGLLFYFKYGTFIADNALGVLRALHLAQDIPSWFRYLNVALPAGISFYTFQTLSYIIDVYRGECEAERHFLRFCGFVTFFPHLVAGPLTRHNQLIPQLTRISSTGPTPRWRAGVLLFLLGLAKKVLIADRLGNLIDPLLNDLNHYDLVTAWLLLFGYGLQIYFDFSGYSEMAIGLGRLWGIELPVNFRSPYRALNPADFWARWHITLSQWFRDYFYLPIVGSANRASAWADFARLLTFVVSGLWHGAAWTFVLWGFYHGVLLVLYRHGRSQWDRLPVLWQRQGMFLLATIGWLPFRARDFHQLKLWAQGLMGVDGFSAIALQSISSTNAISLAAFIVLGIYVSQAEEDAIRFSERPVLSFSWEAGLGVLGALSCVFMNYSSKFLYFKF